MSDIVRQIVDRAGLEPRPTFRAELEAQVDEALRSPDGHEPFGDGFDPDHDQVGRMRRRLLLAVLASAAVLAVAAVVTTNHRDEVVTTPGTSPAPTSSAPTPTVTLPATAPPGPAPTTATPAPTTAATTIPPAATTVVAPPVDRSKFAPTSVTFVSTTKAWALGQDCGQPSCPSLSLITSDDRGATWHEVTGTPKVTDDRQTGSAGVRFANPRVGYLFGGGLWSTHDGGRTWSAVTISGSEAGAEVAAVGAANGVVHVVLAAGDGFRIASSPEDRDAFHDASVVVPYGGGPVPSAQLVLQHAAGWVLENDRTVVDGARLVNGAWSSWTPPCTAVGGPATLAASSPRDMVAVCQEGIWGGPSTPATRLYISSDGGVTFVPSGTPLPLASQSGVPAAATPAVGTVVVAAALASGAPALYATFDGGQHWGTVWTGNGTARWSDLGFTSVDQGVAVLQHDDGSGDMLMTSDGGRHWRSLGFGR